MHFVRPAGRKRMRFGLAIDGDGHEVRRSRVPRAMRRLSTRGFISGDYGWFRSNYVESFLDWTIYGYPTALRSERSDHFILTPDFIAHGQKDLSAQPVISPILRTRYGTPIYNMPPDLLVLPIYLRQPFLPPGSAHERLKQTVELQPQLEAILHMLDLTGRAKPELTWLPKDNYGFRCGS